MTLDTYFPEPRRLLIAGKQVSIAEVKPKLLPPFLRAIGPALAPLAAGNLIDAFGTHGERVIEAVAIATGESAEWLGDLALDDFILIFGEVAEVNTRFFVLSVMPALNEAMARITAALTLGETPSQSSYQEDSPGATAKN